MQSNQFNGFWGLKGFDDDQKSSSDVVDVWRENAGVRAIL